MSKAYTLRPGLLVGLNTTMSGNVKYRKEDLSVATDRHGTETATWKTDRTIADKAEHERAKVTRSQAVYLVRRVCVTTACGYYLCPMEREATLHKAIAEARAMVETFNATAKKTRLGFYVITERLDSGMAEAERIVNAELCELVGAMTASFKAKDAKGMRDAADKAKALAVMLGDAGKKAVAETTAVARDAARRIAKGAPVPEPVEVSTVESTVVVAPVPVTEEASETAKALAALKARRREARARA